MRQVALRVIPSHAAQHVVILVRCLVRPCQRPADRIIHLDFVVGAFLLRKPAERRAVVLLEVRLAHTGIQTQFPHVPERVIQSPQIRHIGSHARRTVLRRRTVEVNARLRQPVADLRPAVAGIEPANLTATVRPFPLRLRRQVERRKPRPVAHLPYERPRGRFLILRPHVVAEHARQAQLLHRPRRAPGRVGERAGPRPRHLRPLLLRTFEHAHVEVLIQIHLEVARRTVPVAEHVRPALYALEP